MAKRWTAREDGMIERLYLVKHPRVPITIDRLHENFEGAGYNRSRDAIRNRAYLLRRGVLVEAYNRRQSWIDGMRFGYLDIEVTGGFKANFGHMISWAMYIPDEPQKYLVNQTGPVAYDLENGFGVDDPNFEGEVLYDWISRRDAINWKRFDKRITKSLLKAIDKVDILVTYWGTGFDVPYMRTRALYWGFPFPKYQEKLHLDLYYNVRSLLKLGRNSLAQATAFFGIEGKSQVDFDVWNRASVGDQEAMEYVIEHNIEDVKILAVLHSKIGGYRQITRRSL